MLKGATTVNKVVICILSWNLFAFWSHQYKILYAGTANYKAEIKRDMTDNMLHFLSLDISQNK